MKLKFRNIILFFVLLIAGAVLYTAYNGARYRYFLQTPVRPGNITNVFFIIKKGDTPNVVAKNLFEKNFILNENTFKTYIRDKNLDRKIVAGRFLLNQNMVIPEIVQKITDPKQGEIIFTVTEGMTVRDIDQKLLSAGLNQPGEFIQAVKDFNNYGKYLFIDEKKSRSLPYPLEGFLFPDTYFLDSGHFKNENLIDLMLKNFQKKTPKQFLENEKQAAQSLFDIIIVASIVEKEVKTAKDRPIVAGILWKRLKNGWQLGADATLLYLKNKSQIGTTELQEDSPYNTRKNTGLPPGPISNPGIASINAALKPESSPYFYYLTRPQTGEVVYAKTNEEHNWNKAKYLH